MILTIYHIPNWIYIYQRKQTQIEKDVIRENSTRIDYNYNIEDKFMVIINQAYKYKTLFQVPYVIAQTWANKNVTIRTGAVIARINIRHIKPYHNPDLD